MRFRPWVRTTGLALWAGVAWPVSAQTADTLSATEIVKRADELLRGKTLQGKYRMTVIRPDWQRSSEFAFWSEATEKSSIRVLSPPKDRGVAFLKLGRQMWQYIPRINRVIKIPPSMMLESWMGSDFTNDDLVKESSIVEDYTHRLLGREKVGDDEAYVIELIPKPDAPVTWARVVEWIRVKDYIPLRAEYYNERGEHVRTLLFSDGRSYLRATLNADYNFPGGYYVFVELHHNGVGARDKAKYDPGALLEGVIFNLAREYAAASVMKNVTPLVSLSLYALQNLNDGSGLAGPALVWSAAENLEVSLSAYVFYGAGDTEFGAFENVYFGSVQFFF